MNALSRWFINNPVAANLLMLALLIGGFLALTYLRVETFPQIEPSSISITVAYPGGTAKQIDEGVTQRIEEAISGIAGIKEVTSESSADVSEVIVEKTADTDLGELLEDIRNQVNSITNFPVEAERPQVKREEFTNLAAFVVVSGPRSDKALQPVARRVELALKKNPKISKVRNWGRRDPLLIIEPDISRLRALGMSLEDVAQKIAQMSLEVRSGELKSSKGRIILRGDGYADNLQKLRNLDLISTPTGHMTLSDIATIDRDYEETGSVVRNNGHNALAMLVSTSQQDNLLQVSRAIKQTLAVQRRHLPRDIKLSVMVDMAPYISDQMKLLGRNALQGLVIILILLGLFLELRLAFWVGVGIPVSICGTFIAMHFFNYSINDITLFGFILVLGILVDDAVVVGESIYTARNRYAKANEAAWYGVREVSIATVFGVLTSIAAFAPMLWINNNFAKLLAGFAAVVVMALCFSLVESKFILPSHLAHSHHPLWQPSAIKRIQRWAQNGLQYFNRHIYRPFLIYSLRHRLAVFLGLCSVVLLAYGMWSKGLIQSAFFPDIPGRYISADVSLQDGAPLPLQEKVLKHLEKSARSVGVIMQKKYQLSEKPISHLIAWSNGDGELRVTLELTHEALSELPANALLNQWRTQSGTLEGAYSSKFATSDNSAGETMLAVASSDRELAKKAALLVVAKLATLPGAEDVYDDGSGGQEQIRVQLNAFGRRLGLTQQHIAKLVGEAFGQRDINRLLDQGQEVKVTMRYPQHQRQTAEQLLHTPVIMENGQSVLLGDVATLSFEREPQVLYRRNRDQVVNIYWEQDQTIQSAEQTLKQLKSTIDDVERRFPGVDIKSAGQFDDLAEVQEGVSVAIVVAILLIYVLLAVPLKSYWQPFLIMSVIPFGFAGSIFGHYLMGLPISILSMFGMMAMTGVVVNDSLVLMTRFNALHRHGVPLHHALVRAGTSRLRAIFLTTITTVCGLIPLLCETAEQAQYLKPAAVSLVFGEMFATVVTLILVPILLSWFSHQAPQQEDLLS